MPLNFLLPFESPLNIHKSFDGNSSLWKRWIRINDLSADLAYTYITITC